MEEQIATIFADNVLLQTVICSICGAVLTDHFTNIYRKPVENKQLQNNHETTIKFLLQKESNHYKDLDNIVGLTALRLAFFMRYE